MCSCIRHSIHKCPTYHIGAEVVPAEVTRTYDVPLQCETPPILPQTQTTSVARRLPIVLVVDHTLVCVVNGIVEQVKPNRIDSQDPKVVQPQGNIVQNNIPRVSNNYGAVINVCLDKQDGVGVCTSNSASPFTPDSTHGRQFVHPILQAHLPPIAHMPQAQPPFVTHMFHQMMTFPQLPIEIFRPSSTTSS